MVKVTSEPINPAAAYNEISARTAGSVVFHYAVVREITGDAVTKSILFERGGDMEAEMESIAAGLKGKYDLEDALIVRRLGLLRVGDIISLVAASSPNRGPAFDACLAGVEALKKMKTVKKTEK